MSSQNNQKSANILCQGAEAILIREGEHVVKDRISKGYRHPGLDRKIIKSRTKREAKLLEKASKLINAPQPENLKEIEASKNLGALGNEIKMPFIEGKKISDYLEKLDWEDVCKKIGSSIAKLHDNNIIHGDLTTSNMILKGDRLFLIDFGLGFVSNRIEDKAVDLHLIKQALEAKHFLIWGQCWQIIEKSYDSGDREKILQQLREVEARGRYKR